MPTQKAVGNSLFEKLKRQKKQRLLQNPTRAALRARHPPQPFGRQAFLAPARSGDVREDRYGYALSSPEQASIQDCRLRGHVEFCKGLSREKEWSG